MRYALSFALLAACSSGPAAPAPGATPTPGTAAPATAPASAAPGDPASPTPEGAAAAPGAAAAAQPALPQFEVVPQHAHRFVPVTALPLPRHGVAILGGEGTLSLYDPRSRHYRAARRIVRRADEEVGVFLATSEDAETIAVSNGQAPCAWHLSTDSIVCPENVVCDAAMHLDRHGRHLYCATSYGGGPPQILSIETRTGRSRSLARLAEGQLDAVEGSALSSDGAFLAIGTRDSVFLITLRDGGVRQVPLADVDELRRDDADFVACTSGGLVHVARDGTTTPREGQCPPAEGGAETVYEQDDGEEDRVEIPIGGEQRAPISIGAGESSLWSLVVADDHVETHRRDASEIWGRTGMEHRRETNVEDTEYDYDYQEFDGLVASSADGALEARLRRDGTPYLRRGGQTVRLAHPSVFECEQQDYCSADVTFAADGSRVAIAAGDEVEMFDATSGELLSRVTLERPCRPGCEDEDVCVDSECVPPYDSWASVAMLADRRWLAIGAHGEVTLRGPDGARVAALAPRDEAARDDQAYAVSPDGSLLAFVRRRRLKIVAVADGAQRLEVALDHRPRWIHWTPDARILRVATTDDRILDADVATGAVTGERPVAGYRAADDARRRVVACRDGQLFVHLVDEARDLGPLGRCPVGGTFVLGGSDRWIGWQRGALARIHRVSDGQVLNLRRITDGDRHVLFAWTDSGWAEARGERRGDLMVREGPIATGRLSELEGSPHLREGLVRAFFGDETIPAYQAPAAPAP
jgi:hypothetical protein